jgi:hypothetical protein
MAFSNDKTMPCIQQQNSLSHNLALGVNVHPNARQATQKLERFQSYTTQTQNFTQRKQKKVPVFDFLNSKAKRACLHTLKH